MQLGFIGHIGEESTRTEREGYFFKGRLLIKKLENFKSINEIIKTNKMKSAKMF